MGLFREAEGIFAKVEGRCTGAKIETKMGWERS
jgi:hypothetical protein